MTPTEFLQQYNIDPCTVVYTGNEDDDNRDGFDLGELLFEYAQREQKMLQLELDLWRDFETKLEAEVEREDSDTETIGEFVMDHFDLWK